MKRQLISNRLHPNAGIMAWYARQLRKLSREMTKECRKVLKEIYSRGSEGISFDESLSSQARIALNQLMQKYGDKFSDRAKKLAQSLIKKTDRYSNGQVKQALNDMLGDKAKNFSFSGSAISAEKADTLKALLFENVSLIKSIPNEYFKQITGAVARSIENGNGISWLASEIKKYGYSTERRAQLIAQDQTRKAYNSINLRNFQEAGIRKFKWLHSGGAAHPREYHRAVLNGHVYDMDDPPVIDPKTGEKGFPGQLPYCRCVMCAVLSFEE
jgi:SPP1 gp7 family putative phage head morphogenesis protein